MLFFLLIEVFFQSVQNHAICTFRLVISPGVRHRDILDEDTLVFTKFLEIVACESRPEVRDNTVRQAESVDDVFEKISCLLGSGNDQRLVLNPFGEFVNGDVDILEVPRSSFERPVLRPQTAKGQAAGIVWSTCAGTWICLAKN